MGKPSLSSSKNRALSRTIRVPFAGSTKIPLPITAGPQIIAGQTAPATLAVNHSLNCPLLALSRIGLLLTSWSRSNTCSDYLAYTTGFLHDRPTFWLLLASVILVIMAAALFYTGLPTRLKRWLMAGRPSWH